jgi:hypothetical protein
MEMALKGPKCAGEQMMCLRQGRGRREVFKPFEGVRMPDGRFDVRRNSTRDGTPRAHSLMRVDESQGSRTLGVYSVSSWPAVQVLSSGGQLTDTTEYLT